MRWTSSVSSIFCRFRETAATAIGISNLWALFFSDTNRIWAQASTFKSQTCQEKVNSVVLTSRLIQHRTKSISNIQTLGHVWKCSSIIMSVFWAEREKGLFIQCRARLEVKQSGKSWLADPGLVVFQPNPRFSDDLTSSLTTTFQTNTFIICLSQLSSKANLEILLHVCCPKACWWTCLCVSVNVCVCVRVFNGVCLCVEWR